MKGSRRSFFVLCFLLFLLFSWFFAPPSQAQEETGKEKVGGIQADEEPEKVVGAPRDIKEKTGIIVFVVWIWLSILVLVYFLRLKIKETDRLYLLRFISSEKK